MVKMLHQDTHIIANEVYLVDIFIML